ncbi:MAG: hypothetical protein LBQ50_02075 [Planctomycetaceae bacterium]|jgi:hypothetical protein|nr:hypothetical protein [Planctomycetaceae bacterium]
MSGFSDLCVAAESIDWSLCIFFSVDIEGATAYKVETRTQKGNDDWCSLFESFYVNLPAYFLNEYSILAENQSTKDIREPVSPTLWKFVGDEILFYAPLTDSSQTLEHLRAFRQAIINYNKKLAEQGLKVRCKGTSWIAGFPINNRIVRMPNEEKNSSHSDIDFIGSSIDCGFRLTKFSSARMLVVSLDLLWMVTESFKNHNDATCYDFIASKIKYAGKYELKGVFSGQPYPVFWIDMFSESTLEDKWTGTTIHCEYKEIVTFCENFSSNINSNDFIKPFIVNDPSQSFNTIPEGFEKQRHLLLDYKNKLKNKIQQTITPQPDTNGADLPHGTRQMKPVNKTS